MVGWSRRNSEASERNRRFHEWWKTLSEEEKEQYRKEQEEQNKRDLKIIGIALLFCFIGFILIFILGGK
jgi:hypothetical protein